MTQVKAAVFRPDAAQASIENIEFEFADLRDDEVLVRLVATGVCHTDLTCRDGFMPLPRPVILGHEGAGVVQEVGAGVTSVEVGDHVVMTFMTCGQCRNCETGRPAYCAEFRNLNFSGRRGDGSTALSDKGGEISSHFFGQSSFASHSVANERNVVRVRSDVPLELLGPLGCGIQTGAGAVMNVLQPAPGDRIAIFGAGGVGLSGVMAAKILGCAEIIVVEPRAERRALALELGASHAVDPATIENLTATLHELASGSLNHVFDTSGIPEVIQQAVMALAPLGRAALVTGNRLDAMLALPLLPLVISGITIRGVNMGDSAPQTFIPHLVDLIAQGAFPLDKLVRFYSMSEFDQALDDQHHGHAVKPIIRMPDTEGE